MPENKSKQNLNPEIAEIEVGVRYLRKVTFYPLSAAHQLKMTDIIETVFKELVGVSQGKDSDQSVIEFAGKVLDIIKENIETIISMICDEPSTGLLEDMTNSQLVEVVKYVYTTNFEDPLKNLLSLFQKEEENVNWIGSILNPSSQQSARSMDINLMTSTGKGIKKEDLPLDR